MYIKSFVQDHLYFPKLFLENYVHVNYFFNPINEFSDKITKIICSQNAIPCSCEELHLNVEFL